jgi:hypothetical protein
MRLISQTIFSVWIPLCLFIVALPGYIMADKKCVGAEIWSDKTEYLPYERINIGFTITNLSANPLATAFGGIGECFYIEDQGGTKYETSLSGYYLNYDTLIPGESFTGSQKIDSRYEIRQPGTYTCALVMPKNFFSPQCPGTVRSNIIEFTIMEPDGLAAKVYERYVQTYNMYWGNDKSLQIRELVYRKFLNLAREFPNSVYAPQSLKFALFGHYTDNHSGVAADGMDFLENCEDIPDVLIDIAIEAVVANYKTLRDKSAAIESMNLLIQNYPGTRISERAEYWLKNIKE